MLNQEKTLLKKLGEETIYSAKGHFKACDLRRQLFTYTLWLCTFINVIGLLDVPLILAKSSAIIGLLGTMALLLWNEGEGKNYRARHKEVGEKYLAIHKEIRTCYFLAECTEGQINELSQRVSEIDRSEKLDIPEYARRRAKRAIEKRHETDNWFLNAE